ncbi:MAG: hypothetical protein LBT47_11920, partial [Deltaproteobacteria bacterium]|nr:hypothetical protein [Deltaproteobacteria bacterium]
FPRQFGGGIRSDDLTMQVWGQSCPFDCFFFERFDDFALGPDLDFWCTNYYTISDEGTAPRLITSKSRSLKHVRKTFL